MQTKVIFISDKLEEFQRITRQGHQNNYDLELMTHVEANRRHVYQNFYDIFIVDLFEPWLAIPPWMYEQARHQYHFSFIFIADHAINHEVSMLLEHRLFKTISRRDAQTVLPDMLEEIQRYNRDHRYPAKKISLPDIFQLNKILGNDPKIKSINSYLEIISKARFAPCLIRGESGSGKGYCARLIHRSNNLKDDLFFIKSCESITSNEFLADLFGVEADNELYGPKRKGLLEMYAGGTLLLKNIEKLSPEAQSKLLLYLEDRTFKPFGSKRIAEANVRIIGTTRHNLEWFVRHGGFNSGLFFHMQAFELHIPALRERRKDLSLLMDYFLQYYNHQYGKAIRSFSPAVIELMEKYKWPGNIAELKNVIERAVLICNSEQITIQELPDTLKGDVSVSRDDEYIGNCTIKELEKLHIERVLKRTRGNKSRAAQILEISRTTLREKMRLYVIGN